MGHLSNIALRNLRRTGELDALLADQFFWTMHRNDLRHGLSPLPDAMAGRLEELRGRARLRVAVQQNSADGKVYLCVTQTDCDCAQWTSRKLLPATPEAVEAYLEQLYANAEGAVHWRFISPEEYAEFTPQSRDLALEAHENGHPHVVYA